MPSADSAHLHSRSDMSQLVITGMGIVSPIGLTPAEYWHSLASGKSGVRLMERYRLGESGYFAGEVRDFDPVMYVKPRKSLKVMSREIQMGFAAAQMAFEQAGCASSNLNPDRMGVLFGAELMQSPPDEIDTAYGPCANNGEFDFSRWGKLGIPELFPLIMLKVLPNMPACHVAIALDARGPNNTLAVGEASGLLALDEACRVLERGLVDVMLVGGTSSWVEPIKFAQGAARELAASNQLPQRACRPFDRQRTGLVRGEGAAVFVVETAQHAAARNAQVLARVLSRASGYGRPSTNPQQAGHGLRHVMTQALARAGMQSNEVGFVQADGWSTTAGDVMEAQAIASVFPHRVAVTAAKACMGHIGAAAGALDLAAAITALQAGQVPPTCNYEEPDPACPIRVISDKPADMPQRTALVLNRSTSGQACAVVLAGA